MIVSLSQRAVRCSHTMEQYNLERLHDYYLLQYEAVNLNFGNPFLCQSISRHRFWSLLNSDFSNHNTLFTTKVINLGSDNKPDDNSHSDASTPVSTSSFGHSVINKRGKTGYDVQKNLSGLMLSSQPSANSRKPFVPPGQTRKTDEESLDDDSIFNMYTALKARPLPLSSHAPPAHFQRRVTGAGSGHGIKRSKFKNPFKVCGREVKSQDNVEISRYVLKVF